MSKTNEIDWNDIDLDSVYESNLDLIDGLTFDDLLLEVNCNCKVIDEESVTKQFEEDLQNRVRVAREIFEANKSNIVRKANKQREN